MKHRIQTKQRTKWLLVLLSGIVWVALSATAVAQTEPADEPAGDGTISVETLTEAQVKKEPPPADYVSIHVDGGTIRQVLNAFAMQTQRNVVIGPEVISDGVSIHLNNVRWDEALDVILKPYGFGYRRVGDTVVVSKLENLASLAAVEPLETRVFTLHFLDAGDVKELIEGQLSSRGSASVVSARGQKGWQFASQGGGECSDTATVLGKLERMVDQKEEKGQVRSKTLIVTDVPSSLARVGKVLAEVDKMPRQILIESRFMEVNEALLKNVGLDFRGASFTLDGGNVGQIVAGTPSSLALGDNSFNALGWDASMEATAIINLLQKDDDTKVLSAPRILTLNNQEATIIVGQKFPIIKTEINESSSTSAPTKSTELERYESTGIQLNVVPQICDDGNINMIVHPSVSTVVGFETIRANDEILVRYPVINTREAETQIMAKDGETIVIGGLLEERTNEEVQKLPLLGSIPLFGRLFHRNTADNVTIDLLIFLSATVVDEDNYDMILAEEEELIEDEPMMEYPIQEMPDPEEAKPTATATVLEDLAAAKEEPATVVEEAKPTATATVLEDLAAAKEEPATVVEEPAAAEESEIPALPVEEEPADKTASVMEAVPVG